MQEFCVVIVQIFDNLYRFVSPPTSSAVSLMLTQRAFTAVLHVLLELQVCSFEFAVLRRSASFLRYFLPDMAEWVGRLYNYNILNKSFGGDIKGSWKIMWFMFLFIYLFRKVKFGSSHR